MTLKTGVIAVKYSALTSYEYIKNVKILNRKPLLIVIIVHNIAVYTVYLNKYMQLW